MGSVLLCIISNGVFDLLPIYSEQLASQNLGVVSVYGKENLGVDVDRSIAHPLVELAQWLVSQRQVQAELATFRQDLPEGLYCLCTQGKRER